MTQDNSNKSEIEENEMTKKSETEQTAPESTPEDRSKDSSKEKTVDDAYFTEEESQTEKSWEKKSIWKRGLAMLGFGFLAGFVRLGITLIAIFQFLALLFTEEPNQPLMKFGQSLNTYQYQINQFLTINTEEYPFPFSDFPESTPEN